MVDTHAHLNIMDTNEIEAIIKRAKAAHVNRIVVIGMDYETSVKAIELAHKYNNLYATVGLHPSYVDNNNHQALDQLYQNEKVIAVGEIGLDYYWKDDNRKLQEKIFEEQIVKAISLDLPVIIHTRNSFQEAYEIVKKYQGKVRGVFHCFSGNLEDAFKAIELGFYIGIDGPITFKKSEDLVKIVENVSLDKILIETDSPYLAPVPFRGKINEPAHVQYVAEKIAAIKNVSFEEVVNKTTNNAQKLFRLEDFK